MFICTSICANYLPKAMALAMSLKKTNPACKFLVCMVEREIPWQATVFGAFDHLVLAKDIGFADFDRFIFKHTVVEAATAVKGQLFQYMLDRYPQEDKFVYLDPDIIVYSDLRELDEILDNQAIVLVPHLLKPGNIAMEISSLQHGVFNLGFLAVRRSAEAKRFIDWWKARLDEYCYDDIPGGIFTDQKWLDLAPGFFNVYILKHAGYDFATWSLKTSRLYRQDDTLFVDGYPLRFIHFSGFDSGTIDWALREWTRDTDNKDFVKLYEEYRQTQAELGASTLGKTPWSYDYYRSGEKIDKAARLACRNAPDKHGDPFGLSNRRFRGLACECIGNSLLRKGMSTLRRDGVNVFFQKTARFLSQRFKSAL